MILHLSDLIVHPLQFGIICIDHALDGILKRHMLILINHLSDRS